MPKKKEKLESRADTELSNAKKSIFETISLSYQRFKAKYGVQ